MIVSSDITAPNGERSEAASERVMASIPANAPGSLALVSRAPARAHSRLPLPSPLSLAPWNDPANTAYRQSESLYVECTPVDGVQLPTWVGGTSQGLAGALPPRLGDLGPSPTVPPPPSSTVRRQKPIEGCVLGGPHPGGPAGGRPGDGPCAGAPPAPTQAPPQAPGPGPAAMPPCLVLVDPSPAATGALRWAAANLAAGAQAIHLVHVVTPKPMVVAGGMGAGMLVEAIHEEVRRPPVSPPSPSLPREADARVQNEVQKKAAKQFMQRVRVDAKSLGFTDVHCTILIASPGAGHAGVGHLVQECVASSDSFPSRRRARTPPG